MQKPICVKCSCELKMHEAGVLVKELYHWNRKVYRVWSADVWKCPECGIEIVRGFAKDPQWTYYGNSKEELEKLLSGKTRVIENREYTPRRKEGKHE